MPWRDGEPPGPAAGRSWRHRSRRQRPERGDEPCRRADDEGQELVPDRRLTRVEPFDDGGGQAIEPFHEPMASRGRRRPERHPVDHQMEGPLPPEPPRRRFDACPHRGVGQGRQGGDLVGHPRRVGQGIAGRRIEQAGPHAQARLGGLAPERVDVPGQGHGDDAGLGPRHPLDTPSLVGGVGGDRGANLGQIQVGRIAVAGILDGQLRRRQGNHMEEAVAVQLVDRGVHEDGVGHAVRRVQLNLHAEELLPAQHQPGRVAATATVDHAGGLDQATVGQPHAVGADLGDLDLGPQVVSQGLRHRPMQPRRADHQEGNGRQPAVAWKADLVGLPPVEQQRRQPGFDPLIDVAGEAAPDMAAAQGRALFEDDHPQVRSGRLQAQREEAVGETSAHERDIDPDGFWRRHALA